MTYIIKFTNGISVRFSFIDEIWEIIKSHEWNFEYMPEIWVLGGEMIGMLHPAGRVTKKGQLIWDLT